MIYLLPLVLLSFDLMAQMPATTPANPNGRWVELPKGRNYIFCGDRMFYSPHFDDKVKIGYEDGEKVASFKKHCKYRKLAVERQAKKAESGNESLAISTYNRLNPILEKIPKSKKHKKHIEENGYHYKELRGQLRSGEINRLRITNLLTPYLSQGDFEKAYAKSSNNPAFIEAEYSRYASNLLTQNPAMLYTADGEFYYFSFNLSEEQLKRLGKTVGHAGGGGAGSSGGSTGGSARSPGSLGKPSGEEESPLDALEQMFPSFNSDENAMRVAPEGTRPPGATSRETLNVPSFRQLSSAFQAPRPSAGLGAGSSGRSSSGAVSGRSSSRSSSSSKRSPSSLSGTSVSPSLMAAAMNQRGSLNRPSSSSITRRQPASTSGSSASSSASPAKAQAPQVERQAVAQNTSLVQHHEMDSLSTDQYEITFADPGEENMIACNKESWVPLLLATSKYGSQLGGKCIPFDNTSTNQTFCGEGGKDFGDKYKNDGCIGDESNSCNEYVKKDFSKTCKSYIEYPQNKLAQETLSLQDLKDCSEIMQALFCNEIPCQETEVATEKTIPYFTFKGFKIVRDNVEIEVPEMRIDIESTYPNHSFFNTFKNPRMSKVQVSLKSKSEILEIPDIKHKTKAHKLSSTNSPITFNTVLNQNSWPQDNKNEVMKDLYKAYAFYEFYNNTNVSCSVDRNNSNRAEDGKN